VIAHPVLPVVPVMTYGACSVGLARRPVWCGGLDSLIVPACAFWLALWLAIPQGMVEE
jgi:hypothetical protein